MSENKPMKENNDGKVYTLYYAFFLIPLMVTILGVMFFFTFKVLTYETNSPMDYLSDVQYGAATKRWQAAFELSKILTNPDLTSLNESFHQRMIAVYEKSIHDDPAVRMYLALAMGRTKNKIYGDALIIGLGDKDEASRVAAIKALGSMSYRPAIKKINNFISKHNSVQERLSATIALGNMADDSVIPTLIKLLDDEEPNVRWDSAIALAKLGDSSGAIIIESLLDRMYYDRFEEVDSDEEVQAILIAIQASDKIPSEKFVSNLLKLATFDRNMKIRNSAINSLSKTYNREI